MRYIDKSVKFDLLDKYKDFHIRFHYKSGSDLWKKFDSDDKIKTFNHILRTQKYLCAYCEQQLDEKPTNYDISHLDHLHPKSKVEYRHLTFNYENLVVSCNGFDVSNYRNSVTRIAESNNPTNESRVFCGPRKDDDYNAELFLNPTKEIDIEEYFCYTREYDEIDPSKILYSVIPNEEQTDDVQQKKADYMINELLNLNDEKLKKLRTKHHEVVVNKIRECKNNQNQIDEFLDFLLNGDSNIFPSFYSMLKSEFSVWHS